jgi:glycolate oxidase iron-sulfur subunit
LATALLKRISRNKTLSRWTQSALGFYQAGGLQKTARTLRLPQLFALGEMDRLLPNAKRQMPTMQNFHAAVGEVKGSVGLFIGCLGSLLDHETIDASVRCLTAAGFNVYLPDRQTCCGALDRHDGDRETADRLAEINVRVFAEHDLLAIVTIASGCGSQLLEYQNSEFAGKVIDISRFLMRSGFNFGDKLMPLDASVCLHTPCSLKNVMRMEQGALNLLCQLPGLKLTKIPETIQCCGSAGAYMLEHPAMAKALADDVLAFAANTKARYLAISNIGCALHLAAGLRDRGIEMEVIHPVALLARQLPPQ